MSTSTYTNRVRRLAAASAMGALLAIGTAGAASAQTAPDQHAGGIAPNTDSRDVGGPVEVGGKTVTRGSGGLPVTGSDIAGLVALGAGAVAVGSTAVVASRRRATRATA